MPPKIRITKEDIVRTGVAMVRQHGDAALNARKIAGALNCSTQPVFSNFRTMEELRAAVVEAAAAVYEKYAKAEIASGKYPAYKATGMAYVRFAAEERELFKLLFMRDRTAESGAEKDRLAEPLFSLVQNATGLAEDKARLFHLEMWVYVHGIAVILATNYLTVDTELISEMLTDAFVGLKKRYEEKE